MPKHQTVKEHQLAIELTHMEGKLENMTIAQIKEVILLARKTLAKNYTVKSVMGWLRKSR